MSRCCGDSCVCKLVDGTDRLGHSPMSVDGVGTLQDPFVVSFKGIDVDDTASVNMSIAWDSTRGYVISAVATNGGALSSLSDVAVGSQTNGQVLSWNSSTSKWVPAAPTTAPGGALSTDTSLSGDGSVGNVLEVTHASGRGTATFTGGIGLTDSSLQQLVRTFANAAARTAADPSPQLNALSVLDSHPGVINYWDGTTWQTLNASTGTTGLGFQVIGGTPPLQLSGPYTGGPVTVLIKHYNGSTDISGRATIFTAADLAAYAGVLGCFFTCDDSNGSGTAPDAASVYYQSSPAAILVKSYIHGSSVPTNVQSGTGIAFVY